MLQDKNDSTTPLSKVGEFGLIDRIKQSVTFHHPATVKGIGDDAAVLAASEHETVVSTDTLIEGVHFNLAYFPLRHLGYKAITTALSDAYAMNAIPSHVFVNVAVSSRFSLEAIDELFSGIDIACNNYKVELAGGDTSSSVTGLMITVTVLGKAPKEKIVYRNGAKENDLLVVSGDLGAAYFGLQILERENEVWKVNPQMQPDLAPYDYLIGRQLRPEARRDVIELLDKLGVQPTSMIDISDGLASETLHLATQSDCGFNIFEEKIPLDQQVISAGEEFDINPVMAALNGGEDYELLFTVPLGDHDKIKGNPNLTVIGHVVSKTNGSHLIGRGNETQIPLTAQGWNAFKSDNKNAD